MDVHAALTVDFLSGLLGLLRNSLVTYLRSGISNSHRLVILAARSARTPVLERRGYLSIPTPEHRAALLRLLASDHPLAVEQLRRRVPEVPYAWRLCRFCARRTAIEDEAHTLLRCPADLLVQPRKDCLDRVLAVRGDLRLSMATRPLFFLAEVIQDADTVVPLAALVHAVFTLCTSVPMVVINSEEQLLQYS